MSETSSLIKHADQQLPLFGSDQMDPALFAAEESGATPEFTGARLFSNSPDTYRAIVALSAEGLGAMRIGKILRVSPNTVLAVRAREPESIDIEKRRLASLSREGARMCVEGIIEMMCDPDQVKKMSIKDKGIVFGILAEKSELLSGSPTARLQTIGAPPAVEVIEYMRWLKTEYDRRMGFGEGKEGEKANGSESKAPALTADTDQANAEIPTCKDQDPVEIVDPGLNGEVESEEISAEQGKTGISRSVGQTPHRNIETPINIESNKGTQTDHPTYKSIEVENVSARV